MLLEAGMASRTPYDEKPDEKISAGAIRRVLDDYFSLAPVDVTGEERGAPSVSGRQLENARLGLTGERCEWSQAQAAEERFARHALLVKLWQSIDTLPQVILRLSLCRVGWVKYVRLVRASDLLTPASVHQRQGGLCLEGLPGGGLCKNHLAPGEFTCAQHRERVAHLGQGGMTARGEVWLRKPRPDDLPPGAEAAGHEMVQGRKDVFPSYRLMAKGLEEEWDDARERQRTRSRSEPGHVTSPLAQLVHTADAARALLEQADIAPARARAELALRGNDRDERKVKYAVERAYGELRTGRGSEWLRVLLAREEPEEVRSGCPACARLVADPSAPMVARCPKHGG